MLIRLPKYTRNANVCRFGELKLIECYKDLLEDILKSGAVGWKCDKRMKRCLSVNGLHRLKISGCCRMSGDVVSLYVDVLTDGRRRRKEGQCRRAWCLQWASVWAQLSGWYWRAQRGQQIYIIDFVAFYWKAHWTFAARATQPAVGPKKAERSN